MIFLVPVQAITLQAFSEAFSVKNGIGSRSIRSLDLYSKCSRPLSLSTVNGSVLNFFFVCLRIQPLTLRDTWILRPVQDKGTTLIHWVMDVSSILIIRSGWLQSWRLKNISYVWSFAKFCEFENTWGNICESLLSRYPRTGRYTFLFFKIFLYMEKLKGKQEACTLRFG